LKVFILTQLIVERLVADIERHRNEIETKASLKPLEKKVKDACKKRLKFVFEYISKVKATYSMSALNDLMLQMSDIGSRLAKLSSEMERFNEQVKEAKIVADNGIVSRQKCLL
jgi:hypothetical protein